MLVDITIKDVDKLQKLLIPDMDKIIKLKKKYKGDKARISILNEEYRESAILYGNLDKIKQVLRGDYDKNQ